MEDNIDGLYYLICKLKKNSTNARLPPSRAHTHSCLKTLWHILWSSELTGKALGSLEGKADPEISHYTTEIHMNERGPVWVASAPLLLPQTQIMKKKCVLITPKHTVYHTLLAFLKQECCFIYAYAPMCG